MPATKITIIIIIFLTRLVIRTQYEHQPIHRQQKPRWIAFFTRYQLTTNRTGAIQTD